MRNAGRGPEKRVCRGLDIVTRVRKREAGGPGTGRAGELEIQKAQTSG